MVPQISVEELKKKLDAKENFLLLDVREPDEHEAARIAGAKLIPMGQVPDRLADLDKKTPIVVQCRSGGRSARITQYLLGQGYQAVNLEGGILAWAERIDPSIQPG